MIGQIKIIQKAEKWNGYGVWYLQLLQMAHFFDVFRSLGLHRSGEGYSMYVVPFSYHERRVSSEHSDGKIKQNIEIYINDVHMYNNHECAPHAPK